MKKPRHYGSPAHTTVGKFTLHWDRVTCLVCLEYHKGKRPQGYARSQGKVVIKLVKKHKHG